MTTSLRGLFYSSLVPAKNYRVNIQTKIFTPKINNNNNMASQNKITKKKTRVIKSEK